MLGATGISCIYYTFSSEFMKNELMIPSRIECQDFRLHNPPDRHQSKVIQVGVSTLKSCARNSVKLNCNKTHFVIIIIF